VIIVTLWFTAVSVTSGWSNCVSCCKKICR